MEIYRSGRTLWRALCRLIGDTQLPMCRARHRRYVTGGSKWDGGENVLPDTKRYAAMNIAQTYAICPELA